MVDVIKHGESELGDVKQISPQVTSPENRFFPANNLWMLDIDEEFSCLF